MKLVYLHGFRTTTSAKVGHFRKMFPDWDVVDFQYDPHKPDEAADALDDYLRPIARLNEEVIVVGTSLGGFWARWVTANYPFAGVLINPSFQPDKTLPIGTYKCYDTGKDIIVDHTNLNEFDKYKCNGRQYSTMLSMDDEIIDPQTTIDELTKTNRVATQFVGGGHRFDNVEAIKKEIERMHHTYVI